MTKLTRSYYCGASYSQIIYETIGNYFDRTCEANPDGDALVVRHQGIRLSYSQLREKGRSAGYWPVGTWHCPGSSRGYLGAQ